MAVRRLLVRNGPMWGEMQPGDVAVMPDGAPVVNATAGNLTVTTDEMLSGNAVYTGALGAVAYTYPTGAIIAAAFPGMAIGDTYSFNVTNTAAQVATFTTAASGTTLSGLVTANANTRTVLMTKTAAEAFTLVHI